MMRSERTVGAVYDRPQFHTRFILAALIVTILAGAMAAAAQSISWRKDYITDDTGRVIATATPVPSDVTPPMAPTDLNASNWTGTSVTLQWTGSTDTGGSGLGGYKIYRGSLPIAAVTGTSYTDNDLQPQGQYVYMVVAFDLAGNHSDASNRAPVPPSSPPAAPSNLAAMAVSTSQINLSWTDNSTNETSFKIERKTGAGGAWAQIDSVGVNVTSYPSTGLASYTTYYYRVRASGPGGDSGYSNEALERTLAPQPTGITVSPSTIDQGQCYTVTVGNGANMLLDVQFTHIGINGGNPIQINGWQPALNANGQGLACTAPDILPGFWTFVKIRNTLNGNPSNTNWVDVSTPVNVLPRQPTSFSVSPSVVTQGQCYTFTVGNGANMQLDVRYTLNGAGPYEIYGWPNLNANGQDSICTSSNGLGNYVYVAVKNHLRNDWIPVNAPITVLPAQPTSFSVSPSVATAGECFVITVGNGANMNLEFQYTYNGSSPIFGGQLSLDGNGQWTECTSPQSPAGDYVFVGMRNALGGGWIPINTPFTLLSPQPASFDLYPSAITQGECYTIAVSNGAYMTLDIQYTYNGSGPEPIIGWPSLDGNGMATICTDGGTPTGTYVYVAIRNTLRTDWLGLYVPVTVYPQ